MCTTYPYPIESGCEIADLIDAINAHLAEQNQMLVWFCSSQSGNYANKTVNAGIFPANVEEGNMSVHHKNCIHHLVSWDWCPSVGKTARSKHYKSLKSAWEEYTGTGVISDRQQERLSNLAKINNAQNYEDEQSALSGHPGVDVRCDGMLGDAGNVWRMWTNNMTDTDLADFSGIAKNHNLPFERGVRAYYVPKKQLKSVYQHCVAAGFAIALDYDAARTYNDIETEGE